MPAQPSFEPKLPKRVFKIVVIGSSIAVANAEKKGRPFWGRPKSYIARAMFGRNAYAE